MWNWMNLIVCVWELLGCTLPCSQKTQEVNQLKSQYSMSWEAMGFRCETSGGNVTKKVNRLAFHFFKEGEMPSADQQQAILIEMVEDLTGRVNHCQSLQPYLSKQPFTANNCEIDLVFKDSIRKNRAIKSMFGVVCYFNDRGELVREPYGVVKERVCQVKQKKCMAGC